MTVHDPAHARKQILDYFEYPPALKLGNLPLETLDFREPALTRPEELFQEVVEPAPSSEDTQEELDASADEPLTPLEHSRPWKK